MYSEYLPVSILTFMSSVFFVCFSPVISLENIYHEYLENNLNEAVQQITVSLYQISVPVQ